MIERNRHPAGRWSNIGFGLLEIVDGIVRVLFLGFAHTRLLSAYTSWQTRQHIKRLKAARRQ